MISWLLTHCDVFPVTPCIFLSHPVYLNCQGQAKLVDHVKKSYSVGDLSAANSADYDNTSEDRRDDESDDDELDNRLLAEQYNRDIAEMEAAAAFEPFQRPATHRGMIWFLACDSICYIVLFAIACPSVWFSHGWITGSVKND